ncbi:MAG: M20/M25/M40 family metallo-hydrolase [Candidatus Aminicenantes bacterium]|nr:M20/M25/M40 family metallo-hydrolase [Candidatus Aminicenantes bacterium]
MKKMSICVSLCLLLLGLSGYAQVKPDGQKAMEHIRYLASDAMRGRKSATPEYQNAAEYVADKMKEYGLEPGGDNGTYFQQAEFKNWSNFEPPTRLDILQPKSIKFIPGRNADFSLLNGTGSGTVRGSLIFAGYGLISEKNNWDDYKDLDVKGKIVLVIPDAPEFLEDLTIEEKSMEAKILRAVEKGAVGIIFMNIGERMRSPRQKQDEKAETWPDDFLILSANTQVLDRFFYMANLSWRTMVSRTLREKKSYTSELDILVEMEAHFTQEDRTAPNVIGILPGKHPQLKEECIIIGGHLDHLGISLDGFINNGADDDASGVAVILELARIFNLNHFHPDRSLVLAAWAGEEMGLVGSRYYTEHPLFPLEKTAVYMNMDMVGCGDEDLFVGGMWEFSDLYDLIKQNLSENLKEKLHYRLNYRGSDHSSFIRKGVTSISLRSGNPLTQELDDEHPEYHRPGDATNIIQPELLQLAAEYHLEVLSFLTTTEENLLDPIHHTNFIHKDSTLVDMHCDTIGRFFAGQDLTLDNPQGHIDIPKLQRGAVDLQVFACYVAPPQDETQKNQAANRAFEQIDSVHQLIEENPDDLLLVLNPTDLRQLSGTRKTGVFIGIEGGYAIENDLHLLRSFYRSGVRLMTLTHWTHTDWADASGDPEAAYGGLTEFGIKVVQEMNKLGMIIDVSHSHEETFWDVIETTDSPIVASHSCARALSDHHRNMSDEMLKALAKNDGVIGINFYPGFLNAENDKKLGELRSELLKKHGLPEDEEKFNKARAKKRDKFDAEYKARSKELRKSLPPVDVKTVVDHIDHVVKVTGKTDYVGLGSDFDGIGSPPVGLENVGLMANITAELVKRGYSDADIKKILGGNFLRVFQKVSSKNN